ncbi:hypothetical protein [Listeria fleischmannii]|uniref:Uncharacterized protein n=1 Tax=Listeria fleischmannii FSL S10-1203 TaxID=1265822 RepID=W7DGX4_9LIST|nr:hypothetical protein [Listeria fleischmannii]EUJ48695.1 hypothetical protein MCOL2_17157 [Listeria fleischmannii FSL S10-1203]
MRRSQTHDLMRKAVPLAREMQGDWNIRMSMALKSVIIDHYLNQSLSKEVVQKLLAKGVSYRRISKHYGVYHRQIVAILN